jgi:hypothetical protein
MSFRLRPSQLQSPSLSPSLPVTPIRWTPTPPLFSQSQAASSRLPSLTPTPLHRVPPSRQGSIGPVRTQQVGLRPDNPELPALTQVERGNGGGFNFNSRSFFITWSQIGDIPNGRLEALMETFGDRIECE